LRDWGYDLVARNRYRLFGKHDTCPMPTAETRSRFLDLS
jgi:predicted DCC family thiol-disulfide oxidoreductase YuxK